MPSQVALSSVFRLAVKALCSTFNYLYLFERIFQVVGKDDFLVPFLSCVFMLHFIGSISKKKKSKGSNYCWLRIRKRSFHILLERDDWKLRNQLLARLGLQKTQKNMAMWTLESFSKPSLGHEK